jgi:hypothetical protein
LTLFPFSFLDLRIFEILTLYLGTVKLQIPAVPPIYVIGPKCIFCKLVSVIGFGCVEFLHRMYVSSRGEKLYGRLHAYIHTRKRSDLTNA